MKAHEIAAQFDSEPGYRIVEFGEVGIPIWAVAFVAVAREVRPLDPVSEFALRCLGQGYESESDIAGVLGLSKDVVCGAFALLFSQDLARPQDSDGTDVKWALTALGRTAVNQEILAATTEIRRTVLVDGWTRKPTVFRESELLSPRELATYGLPEMRAFPQRAPEAGELDPQEVQQGISLALRREEEDILLLSVARVERANRLYIPAVALVYKPEKRGNTRIEFVLNGRISPAHGAAFAANNGVEKMAVFRGLLQSATVPSNEDVFGKKLASHIKSVDSKDGKGKRELAVARLKATIAREKLDAVAEAEVPQAKEELQAAERKVSDALERLAKTPVKHLLTYEHPPLMYQALEKAVDSLVIISPWIRAAVVTPAFLQAVRECLKRSVNVYIGYGIGQQDQAAKPRDLAALKELEKIARDNSRLSLRHLGDTHAKVLIKDEEFCVVGSFNWLSFEGDPERTFREEWSTLVSIPEVVREFKETIVARFSA